MAEFNLGVISGNLVADPEARDVGQSRVVKAVILSTRRFQKRDSDTWDEETTRREIETWNEYTGDKLLKFQKGDNVTVIGSAKQSTYDRKVPDGEGNDSGLTVPATGEALNIQSIEPKIPMTYLGVVRDAIEVEKSKRAAERESGNGGGSAPAASNASMEEPF